jgi:hypothetical protein
MGIIHVFKACNRNQLIRMIEAIIDGGLVQDTTHMKLDVLSAMYFIQEA